MIVSCFGTPGLLAVYRDPRERAFHSFHLIHHSTATTTRSLFHFSSPLSNRRLFSTIHPAKLQYDRISSSPTVNFQRRPFLWSWTLFSLFSFPFFNQAILSKWVAEVTTKASASFTTEDPFSQPFETETPSAIPILFLTQHTICLFAATTTGEAATTPRSNNDSLFTNFIAGQ